MNRLASAMQEIQELPDQQKIPMGKPPRQKFYTTVATRVEIIRNHFGEDCRIITSPITRDMTSVVMKAELHLKNNGEWSIIGTGHAEEFRSSNYINKTSALENCETSAIGRALASAGLHGGEYASEFEVKNAKTNKPSITEIKQAKVKTIGDNEETSAELTDLVKHYNSLKHIDAEELIANVKKEFKLGKKDSLLDLPAVDFQQIKDSFTAFSMKYQEEK